MADTKLADLTALTTTSDDDLLYVVDDPAGTPADRKLALSDVFKRGTVTTSSPVIDAAQTWNASGVTFTGMRLNVTDTASAAASLLMDLQVGGSSAFNVSKGGSLKLGRNASGTNVAGSNVTIAGSQGTGTGAGGSIIFQVAPAGSSGSAQNALSTALTIDSTRLATFSGKINVAVGNTTSSVAIGVNGDQTSGIYLSNSTGGFSFGNYAVVDFSSGCKVWSGATIGFTSGQANGTQDIFLARDAANTLALRNGTNTQTFRVYSTFTDASNYERGALNAGADFIELAAETAGTGDDNLDVRLTPAGTGNVRFGTHTGTADTAVSGYIEIKDSGGTIRKLAVIS